MNRLAYRSEVRRLENEIATAARDEAEALASDNLALLVQSYERAASGRQSILSLNQRLIDSRTERGNQ